MIMRIGTDTTRCVGAGQCVLIAPDLFDQDDDGLVTVIGSAPDRPVGEAARQAARICPSGAITLHES